MAEDKYIFKTYCAGGEGIIDSGYYDHAVQIIQVTSGRVLVSIGTEVAEAHAGDFLFVPASMVFRVTTVEGRGAVRCLVFDSAMIEENMENIDSEIYYMFFVQSSNKIAMFRSGHPIYETLAYSMNEAYEEYMSKDVCYRLPVRAHVYLLVSALMRYYSASRDELDRMIYHNVMRLRPVIEYISKNYGEKIYVETLSDMIAISPDYFTKMFKDSIGKTPIDYINGLRINHSLRLLSMTDTPINDIADMLGFTNPNYFHKIFKSYMDTSPLAYRKSSKR